MTRCHSFTAWRRQFNFLPATCTSTTTACVLAKETDHWKAINQPGKSECICVSFREHQCVAPFTGVPLALAYQDGYIMMLGGCRSSANGPSLESSRHKSPRGALINGGREPNQRKRRKAKEEMVIFAVLDYPATVCCPGKKLPRTLRGIKPMV